VNTLSQATNPQTINNFSSVLNTVGAKKFWCIAFSSTSHWNEKKKKFIVLYCFGKFVDNLLQLYIVTFSTVLRKQNWIPRLRYEMCEILKENMRHPCSQEMHHALWGIGFIIHCFNSKPMQKECGVFIIIIMSNIF
jgi:hypothetical protein